MILKANAERTFKNIFSGFEAQKKALRDSCLQHHSCLIYRCMVFLYYKNRLGDKFVKGWWS